MNRFFRQYYGPFIVNKWTVVGAVVLLVAYLTGAIYGAFQLQDGLQASKLVPIGSNS